MGFEPKRARGDRKSPAEIFVPSGDSLLMSEQAIAKRMNVTNGTQEFLFNQLIAKNLRYGRFFY